MPFPKTLKMTNIRHGNLMSLFKGSALEFVLSDFGHIVSQNKTHGFFYFNRFVHITIPYVL